MCQKHMNQRIFKQLPLSSDSVGFKSAQRGFTLLELMAVVAIVAILAAVAVPSMQSLIESSKIDAKRNQLAGAVKLARSEAVTRGLPVQLCPSSDGATCGGTLADGWIVLEDDAGTLTLIEAYQKSSNGLTLGGDFDGVTFQPSGRASTGGGTTFSITSDNITDSTGFELSVVGSLTYN